LVKAKPTPVSEAVGMSVERTVPGIVANSSAPERNWVIMSVSLPS